MKTKFAKPKKNHNIMSYEKIFDTRQNAGKQHITSAYRYTYPTSISALCSNAADGDTERKWVSRHWHVIFIPQMYVSDMQLQKMHQQLKLANKSSTKHICNHNDTDGKFSNHRLFRSINSNSELPLLMLKWKTSEIKNGEDHVRFQIFTSLKTFFAS